MRNTTGRIPIGTRFHKLVVLEFIGTSNGRPGQYKMQCDCGNTTYTSSYALKSGHSKGCGCLIGGKIDPKQRKLNVRYHDYERSAKKRGYTFELSKETFSEIISHPCEYCGGIDRIGVDRVDNTNGYIEGNVVACCNICNRAKDVMTKEEFLEWISRVYNHQKQV